MRFLGNVPIRPQYFSCVLRTPKGVQNAPKHHHGPLISTWDLTKRVLSPFLPAMSPWAACVHMHGPTSGCRGWNPCRGIPWGLQTRGRAFGPPLLLGVQRPNHGCRVSTKAPCARPQGERALTNPGQQVEPAAQPEVGGPIGPQIPPRAALGHARLQLFTYVKPNCPC